MTIELGHSQPLGEERLGEDARLREDVSTTVSPKPCLSPVVSDKPTPSLPHLREDVSTTVSHRATEGSAVLISMSE